jgi:hypothetical protein
MRTPSGRSELDVQDRRQWGILKPDEIRRVTKAFTDEQARVVFLTLVLTCPGDDERVFCHPKRGTSYSSEIWAPHL